MTVWLVLSELGINTCTCIYTLLVFVEGRKTTSGTKQPHVPLPALMPRKSAGGGGGGGRGGGGHGHGQGGGKYLCVCFCENQPKSYIFFIFRPQSARKV